MHNESKHVIVGVLASTKFLRLILAHDLGGFSLSWEEGVAGQFTT